MTKWTQFWDMSSGGGQKEDFAQCFIEAPEEEAKVIFYNRFGHNPDRVTCTCCGNDYSISESDSLQEATAYQRGCMYVNGGYREEADPTRSWNPYIALEDYEKLDSVCVIRHNDIKDEERSGDVPEEGYVWVD